MERLIWKFDEKKPPFWEFLSVQRTKYLHSIQAAIYDCACKGRVVIVGRGGQVLLNNVPGTLHVRIFASFDLCVKRLMEREGIDEKLRLAIILGSRHPKI